jgi:hypothetical protein
MPQPTKPVVEAPPHDESRSQVDGRALGQRIRQQELLAELGVTALRGTPFVELLNETVRVAAEVYRPNSVKCWSILHRINGS